LHRSSQRLAANKVRGSKIFIKGDGDRSFGDGFNF